MKYFIAPIDANGQGLKFGGMTYRPGEIVEIVGRTVAEQFGDRLMPITDATLMRNLEVNSHPLYVLAPHRWARVDYQVGDVIWCATRASARLIADWTRPATGEEVMAWVERQQVARAARKRGEPMAQRAAETATGGIPKRGPGRPRKQPVRTAVV